MSVLLASINVANIDVATGKKTVSKWLDEEEFGYRDLGDSVKITRLPEGWRSERLKIKGVESGFFTLRDSIGRIAADIELSPQRLDGYAEISIRSSRMSV